jgi:hypothetical protein
MAIRLAFRLAACFSAAAALAWSQANTRPSVALKTIPLETRR